MWYSVYVKRVSAPVGGAAADEVTMRLNASKHPPMGEEKRHRSRRIAGDPAGGATVGVDFGRREGRGARPQPLLECGSVLPLSRRQNNSAAVGSLSLARQGRPRSVRWGQRRGSRERRRLVRWSGGSAGPASEGGRAPALQQ